MPITSFPTGTNLATALTALGVSVPAGVDLDNVADQATAKVYSLIGYPFIEQSSAVRLLDAPCSDVLYLPCWYSAVSAVAIGVSETDTTGTALNIGTDCFLIKNQYGVIRAIQFVSSILGSQESIKVTGTAGYTDDIPGGLYQAVLDYGCALAVNRARMFGGTLKRVKQGDTEKEWVEPPDPQLWVNAAEKMLIQAAAPYKVFPGVC